MNIPLKNLRNLAVSLNIMPFYELKHSKKKGTIVHFKPKTKEELIKEINSINSKQRKKLMKLSFSNHTMNNSGKKKSLVTTQRQKRCPRLQLSQEKSFHRKSPKKCDDVQIRKNCKFVRKGNQPAYSNACFKHFPCVHKKGYAELNNANNYKHYLQTQNINYKYSPSTLTKRESRQNYGFNQAKNLMIVRSKTNLALMKKNKQEKIKLILLNNGNTLEVKKNNNGILKLNKK